MNKEVSNSTGSSQASNQSKPGSLIITAPTLLVADIERSTRFYRDQVGLELYRTNDGFANFKMGDLILALWQLDHVDASIEHRFDPAAPRSQHSMMACLQDSCGAVDESYRRLMSNGVEFLYPPRSFPWNVYACYFKDPDGFMWEIFAWQDGGPEAGGHDIHTATSD